MLACAAAIDALIQPRREIFGIADQTRDEETELALRTLVAGGVQ